VKASQEKEPNGIEDYNSGSNAQGLRQLEKIMKSTSRTNKASLQGTATGTALLLVLAPRMADSTCVRLRALRVVLFACVMPAAAVSVAVAGTYLMGSTIKYTPNLFFCAVVFSSWLGGLGAGIFSVFLSVIALDYYFIPPIYALGLSLEETPDMIFLWRQDSLLTG
jgi:K+-sensing histidine kinase KdpD